MSANSFVLLVCFVVSPGAVRCAGRRLPSGRHPELPVSDGHTVSAGHTARTRMERSVPYRRPVAAGQAVVKQPEASHVPIGPVPF